MHTSLIFAARLAIVVLLASAASERVLGAPPREGAQGTAAIRFEETGLAPDVGPLYRLRGRDHDLLIDAEHAAVVLHGARSGGFRLRLAGAGAAREVCGVERMPGLVNILRGADPRGWRRGLAVWGEVHCVDALPGVDLVFHGRRGELELDLVVAPGADARGLELLFEPLEPQLAAPCLELTASGELEVRLVDRGEAQCVLRAPELFQEVGGRRTPVEGRFVLAAADRVRFEVGAYDPTAPLVIDPVLVYSTFLGGRDTDVAMAIALDASGASYVVGSTRSKDFPVAGPIQTFDDGIDVFVTKLSPDGDAIVFSTYLGGRRNDVATDVAVDDDGNVWVAGSTNSNDFPTASAFQGERADGYDGFVARLTPDGGMLVYSTYLGGRSEDGVFGLAIDGAGNAHVTGSTKSGDFPVAAALQESKGDGTDCFITKLAPAGDALVYSTFLGGGGSDGGVGIALGGDGSAYVVGTTKSDGFPLQDPFQDRRRGGPDAFVSRLSADGAALIYSTYLGGDFADAATAVALDDDGSIYVVGTTSSNNFPLRAQVQSTRGGKDELFISKLDAAGSGLVFSTYFGGNAEDYGLDIAVGGDLSVVVVGQTASKNFPVHEAPQAKRSGRTDAFVTRLVAAGNSLAYSTFLGGGDDDGATAVALDADGIAHVVGSTRSGSFPTTDALQAVIGGGRDAFVTRVSPETVRDLAIIDLKPPGKVKLSDTKPEVSAAIKVKLQNRGQADEVIEDLETLESLVTLEIVSLGACDAPVAALRPPKSFPVTIKSKKTLSLTYDVVFDCANDPLGSTGKDPGHEDFSVTATADRAAIGDGDADANPDDDVCPHDALPGQVSPNPDGRLKDKGCGGKKDDGTRGAPVLVDVQVK